MTATKPSNEKQAELAALAYNEWQFKQSLMSAQERALEARRYERDQTSQIIKNRQNDQ